MAAIEVNTGDVRSHVELLSHHMISGGKFGPDTFPSTKDLDREIDAATREIIGWFAANDYDPDPINWSDNAKGYIARYNALGAAYFLELAHTGQMFSATQSSRAETYFRLYMGLKELLDKDQSFVELGIPIIAGNRVQAHFTGGTVNEKKLISDNTAMEQPLFIKRQFRDSRKVSEESN